MKRIFTLSIFLLSFLGFTAGLCAQTSELRFGWPYETKDVEKLCQYLSKEMGMKITIVPMPDYKSYKSKTINDSIDFCYLNSFSYILASNEKELEPVLMVCLADAQNNPISYQSLLLASKASGVSTTQQLKEQSKQLNLAFVNSSSTSGHLVPRIYFNSLGLDQVEGQFQDILFTGSHEASLKALAENKVQIASCSANELEKAKINGIINDNQYTKLWTSTLIPEGPIVCSKKLDPGIQQKLIAAFEKFNTASPADFNDLKSKSSMAKHAEKYIKAKEEYFNNLRQITNSMEDLLQVLINFYLE